MKKLKVYLDTSVISYLKQEDTPDKMQDTLTLWEMFKDKKYEVYLSKLTLKEVFQCPEPKRQILLNYLEQIDYVEVSASEESLVLAEKIIDMGILRPKSFDDCQHIALAIISNCDCIISWNFKHIVNIKTIHGVRAITNLEGYKTVDILNPSVLLESEG